MALRLLHLSDIHFGGYGPEWDDDEDQREQLVEDLKTLVAQAGTIDGILIGGDVAFSGKAEEYARAQAWVDQLVDECGCAPEAVWVIPGNHDIDRSMLARSAILQDFRVAVRNCEAGALNDVLRRRLGEDPLGGGLTATLEAYNSFAFPLGCAVSSTKFFWEDNTVQVDGRLLLLWGMNSVLVSDKSDSAADPDTSVDANLVLGKRQCSIRKLAGAVRLALVHHPPNWIRDWSGNEHFVHRAHVVLFGHEHIFKTRQVEAHGTVHVHAGAVCPEKGDDWVPSYNVLTLGITGDTLHVTVQPRVWDPDETEFAGHPDGTETFAVRLARGVDSDGVDTTSDEPDPAEATPLAEHENVSGMREPTGEPSKRRQLVHAYLSAPPTRRDQIARKLGVLDDADLSLPPRDLYGLVLKRVRDRDLIDALEKELSQ